MLDITLAVDHLFLRNWAEAERELSDALSSGVYRRLQVSVDAEQLRRHAVGEARSRQLAELAELVVKHGVQPVFSVRYHHDRGMARGMRQAVQAKAGTLVEAANRICPNDEDNTAYISDIISSTLSGDLRELSPVFHLSYFQYENVFQCLCAVCRREFTDVIERLGVDPPELTQASHVLRDDIILPWVEWRQQVIGKHLGKLVELATNGLSIELDYDFAKHYLVGSAVEDGLSLPHLAAICPEIYLHVEPCLEAKDVGESPRKGALRRYDREFRYLRAASLARGSVLSLFFWQLQDPERLAANASAVSELWRRSGRPSLVLFTRRPVGLTEALEDTL
jgi:hypothetical protein